MKIEHLAIGFFVFALAFSVCLLVLGNVNYNYNAGISTAEFTGISNNITEDTFIMGTNAKDNLGGESASTVNQDSLLVRGWKTFSGLWNSFKTLNSVLQEIAKQIGISPIFITTAYGIFVVLFVVALAYLIYGVVQR